MESSVTSGTWSSCLVFQFLLSDDASLEEGEISEEEEDKTKETYAQYDRARYYGSSRDTRTSRPSSSDLVLESPASPEMVEQMAESRREVPTIPMEKEPRLPPELEERGGWVQVSGPQEQEQPQEEEDLDEDLLYLRLIALRSLATEKEEEEKREKEAEGKAEMLELLEEARNGDPAGGILTLYVGYGDKLGSSFTLLFCNPG